MTHDSSEKPVPPPMASNLAENPSFRPILEKYVAQLPQMIEQLELAREQADRETLNSITHRLKGTAANYGFANITETARSYQEQLREGAELSDIAPLLDTLLEQLREAVRQFK